MRIITTLTLLFISVGLSAQYENSLLWKISGNGLQQSSYLYGTMHVSKRIAFRLDDVFYEALEQSEVIALESDPDTWLENVDNLGFMGYGQGNGFVSKGFYTYPFRIKNPRKEEIAAYLAFEDKRVNNILYRTDEYSQNFEEETYLDMFIYQAGKKFGKKIVALEDLEESSALVGRANLNALKQKPDEWLQKKMLLQNPMSILQDAYRNRNISLLDSIDKAMYTQHYLKNMLFIRNHNMADRLDSIMHTGKIFTGIGAAHLPGKKGVIALLRAMGYTVKPLVSRATAKGRQLKAKFEKSIRENTYTTVTPDDAIFSIDLPTKLYPVTEHINTTYISPNLANGSYVMVNRIPTFSYLKKDDVYSLDALDKLLFENIPGEILEKERITRNGFAGLDIKNRLKNGDHQRYHIYITPLEILIFKMGGEGDYVVHYSDTIFNSIRFRRLHKKKSRVSSGYADFEIQMPSFYTFSNRFRNGERLVQGYDSLSGSYYFLRKATLHDINFIEEDSFELKQIQKRFYQDLKLLPVFDEPEYNSLTSKAMVDSAAQRQLHLKTTFRRGDYYLMGALTTSDKEASTFFDSFKLDQTKYLEPFRKIQDTAMFFSTVTSIKPPK
ncbi:MAG: TraB/GumN family protein, partial [Flavobacteriaceae bacterium]